MATTTKSDMKFNIVEGMTQAQLGSMYCKIDKEIKVKQREGRSVRALKNKRQQILIALESK